MGYLTKLQAVNRIIRGAGEYPVSSIAGSGLNDTLLAEQVLNETVVQIQMQGLTANVSVKTYSPDSDGIIWLPTNTMSAEGWDSNRGENLSVRGGTAPRLYNLDDDTDVFEDSKVLRVVRRIDFEDLETHHQFWCTDLAAYTYHMNTVGDPATAQMLMQQAMESRMKARAHDVRQSHSSFLDGDPSLAQGARRNIVGWY